MFKFIAPRVFSFDIEWVPDPVSAELLFGLKHHPPQSYEEAFRLLWEDAGATPELPRPFVKTPLCRIVSICGILREQTSHGVSLKLVSLPREAMDTEKWTERHILECFYKSVGPKQPQLVGYNSQNSDVPILIQRAIAHGIDSFGFAKRPDKPWEGADYFSTAGDYNIDLATIVGRWGRMPRLHEIAVISGIPGKIDVSGDNVWDLWLQGRFDEIVHYNEFDALTTHLLWARIAHFGGLLSDTDYRKELELVEELVDTEINQGKPHLKRFQKKWAEITELLQQRRP
ncbi:MAG: hypothetical protein JW739_02620 [Opitutales bacterium]|nr:hypothetical protein [Opitutales bacterium]